MDMCYNEFERCYFALDNPTGLIVLYNTVTSLDTIILQHIECEMSTEKKRMFTVCYGFQICDPTRADVRNRGISRQQEKE